MSEDNKKTVLAFDTAMSGISVGVIASNGHVVSRQMETQRGQASHLIPLIEEVLSEAQIGFNDINLIGTSMGPGSFTGLRIGLTTAKTLALSLEVPMIGLNTLRVMAHHYAEPKQKLLIVLETKRTDFYAQYFDSFETGRSELMTPFSGDRDAILARAPAPDFKVGGDCLERFEQGFEGDLTLLDNWVQPDPIIMAQLALQDFEAGKVVQNVEPLYLRDADVSMSKNPPRNLAV